MGAPAFAEPPEPLTSHSEPPAPDVRPDEPQVLALPAQPATPACPVCRGRSWSKRRWFTSLRNCADCGTVLNDRSGTRAEEEARYRWSVARADEESRDHAGGRTSEAKAASVAEDRWRFVRRQADGTPHRVLDVGCGAGAFLEAARRDGAEVCGIEIDPVAANRARARGLSVTIGSICDSVPLGYGWDAVTLWDVVDHLDEPAEALARLIPRMKPGGLLVVRGRNATLHAPIKRLTLFLRRVLPFLVLPDPAVVHRFGLRPEGWARLLDRAGFEQVRLHPSRFTAFLPSVLLTARAPLAAPPAAWEKRSPVAGRPSVEGARGPAGSD